MLSLDKNQLREQIDKAFVGDSSKQQQPATKGFKPLKILRNTCLILALWFIGSGLFIHVKAYAAQFLLTQAWQATEQGKPQKPWPWADTWPVIKLQFPSLNTQQIVLAGDSGQALAFGPGLSSASVAPGQAGTMVISGHRDTHFSVLQHLNPSETIMLENAQGEQFNYQIVNIEVIDINRQQVQQTDYQRLLLVTCYPFEQQHSDTSLRYVIEALPIENNQQQGYIASNQPSKYSGSRPVHF